MKLFLTNHQSPGDILMITAAVRDLKNAYPNFQINVKTTAQELWDNNPYLDKSITPQNSDKNIELHYPLVHQSNQLPYHFIHGFRIYMEDVLKIKIPQGEFKVDIHLSEQEKTNIPFQNLIDYLKPVWIVDAGYKLDFTCKMWEFDRYQQVIDNTKDKITWVQIGAANHIHHPLKNTVNLIGKTTHRQLIQLVYHTDGVLTPVSYPMHLATIPAKNNKPKTRPCIVIAGAREPNTWEQYKNHQYIHTLGILECSKQNACWKSRVQKINDNKTQDNSICTLPVKTKSGQIIPKCLDLITAEHIINLIRLYI